MFRKNFKIFITVTAAVFFISLAGCGNTSYGPAVIGIILPAQDGFQSIREGECFSSEFRGRGYNCKVLFCENLVSKERSNAELLIACGIKVLIINSLDSRASTAVADDAQKAGIKVIAYNSPILNTSSIDFFVTFDAYDVGRQQGQFLVENASGKGNPLYLYAGWPENEGAFIFFETAWSVLQPKIADGTFLVKNSPAAVKYQNKEKLSHSELAEIIGQISIVSGFDISKKLPEANLTKAEKKDKGKVYILAPMDNAARTVSDAFTADRDVTECYITGQNADKASIQYIINGKQSMTVLKDERTLVKEAVNVAAGMLEQKLPYTDIFFDNGKKKVPVISIPVLTVKKDNIKTLLFETGYYTSDEFTSMN